MGLREFQLWRLELRRWCEKLFKHHNCRKQIETESEQNTPPTFFDFHCKIDNFDVEDQGFIRWNHTFDALFSVCIFRWTCKCGLLMELKLAKPFIPAADHLTDSNLELEGFFPGMARVEDLAVWGELTSIVNRDVRTLRNEFSVRIVVFFYLHIRF